MRVVFMGTPQIAAVCLQKILDDGFDVVAVYTQPDRPSGRGMRLTAPPVKELAQQAGIPVFQPEHFRQAETIQQLARLKPDVVAAVAYGRILPPAVLEIPPLGCINIHASLLPQYRGSAPYQWAILDGQKQTGVTAQYMAAQMDAGDVIDAVKTDIDENETAGQLLERLAQLGAGLLSRVLTAVENGTASAVPQRHSEATMAPMLDKSYCPIDWNRSAAQIHNQVRGLHPWPVATMMLQGQRFKVHETRVVPGSGQPGEILELNRDGLVIACGQDAIAIRQLQAPGGKRMAAWDYFRGHPLQR